MADFTYRGVPLYENGNLVAVQPVRGIVADDGLTYPGVLSVDAQGNRFTYNQVPNTWRREPEYVKAGLVLHFDGENNTGGGHNPDAVTWKDLSGSGNDGVINGQQYFQWSTNGLLNTAPESSSAANIDTQLNLNNKPRTYYFTTSDVSAQVSSLLVDTSIGGNVNGLFVFHSYAQKRMSDALINTTRLIYNFTGAIIKNYAVVLDENNLALYVNGSLYQTIANYDGLSGYFLRIFGGRTSGQTSKQMKLYNVLAYNRSLSSEEIKQNYKIDAKRFNISV